MSEVLKEARELLTDPAHWTQEAPARDDTGNPVHPTAATAVCWCLEAAVGLCADPSGAVPYELLVLLDQAALDLFPNELRIEHVNFDTGEPEEPTSSYFANESANYVNDILGHEAALAVLDHAIELAGRR
jgi:hypothetical protein